MLRTPRLSGRQWRDADGYRGSLSKIVVPMMAMLADATAAILRK
jgi:hypothetical protein